MTPDAIREVVRDIPLTIPERGLKLYEHIVKHKARRCLELGFAHGVGSVWMGGAIAALGGGTLCCVDRTSARERRPDAPSLVQQAGLENIVDLHFDPISYTWHLKRNLEVYEQKPFDFVFIDGAHNWDTDGFAFFLVDRILKPGGWVLFDDLDWTYASSPSLKNSDFVKTLTSEERYEPQVRAIWEKLVLTNANYGNFLEDAGWGWAQKIKSGEPRSLLIRKTYSIRLPRDLLRRIARKLQLRGPAGNVGRHDARAC